MKLSKQQQTVYNWFRDNPRTTIREASRALYIDKVSARLSEIERLGVDVQRHGRNKSREMLYSIGKPMTKRVSSIEVINGVAVETFKEVAV